MQHGFLCVVVVERVHLFYRKRKKEIIEFMNSVNKKKGLCPTRYANLQFTKVLPILPQSTIIQQVY